MSDTFYCKKCGRTDVYIYGPKITTCDVCQSKMYEVPDEYMANFRWRDGDGKQALKEELVKTSPEFDQYLFDHCDEIVSRRNAQIDARLTMGKAVLEGRDKGNPYGIECPYCKATNVKKIGGLSKAGSVALWGVFALGKTNKQWHCKHCGSDF